MKKYEIDIGQLISNEEAEAKVRQEKELDQQEIQFDKVLFEISLLSRLFNKSKNKTD